MNKRTIINIAFTILCAVATVGFIAMWLSHRPTDWAACVWPPMTAFWMWQRRG